jgi:hypothetical protein
VVDYVQLDDNGGVAKITASVGNADHRFSARVDDKIAIVQFEETMGKRATMRTETPPTNVWKSVMQSDELTAFIERHGAETVVRERRWSE